MSKEIRNSIFNLPEGVGGSGSSYWTPPIPTEKTYSVLESNDDGKYKIFSSLSQNPRHRNKVIMLYCSGASPNYDDTKVLKIRTSNDKGKTFGVESTAYDPSGVLCVQECHSNYDSNGRLHVLLTLIDDSDVCSLVYLYSDNNGGSFVSEDISALVNDATYVLYRNSGRLIENNGVMLAALYSQNATPNSYRRYCLRLVAGTWTKELVETTVAVETESSIEVLSGNNIIMLTRSDATMAFIQYLSTDNGLTWTRIGTCLTGTATTLTALPGQLHKFSMNGEDIIAMYWPKNPGGLFRLYAIYGKASDLLSLGVSGWNKHTEKLIVTVSGAGLERIFHGKTLHYDGNYNAIGCWPFIRTDYASTSLKLFEVDTTDYQYIYDLLIKTKSTDVDANNFLVVTGITDATINTALTDLSAGLKTNSLFTKVKAMYPFVGGTESLHKWNFINPKDLDSAFRLTFVDGAGVGWVHAVTGAKPDGTGAYADTHFRPVFDGLVYYSSGLGYYSRTDESVTGVDIGCTHVNGNYNPCNKLRIRYTDDKGRYYCYNGYAASDVALGAVIANSLGFFFGSRTGKNDNRLFINGTQSGVTNTANALNYDPANSYSFFIGADNVDGVAATFAGKECALVIITDGLTPAEATILNTLVQAFETTLGRNV